MSDYYKSLSFFSLLHSSIKYTAFHSAQLWLAHALTLLVFSVSSGWLRLLQQVSCLLCVIFFSSSTFPTFPCLSLLSKAPLPFPVSCSLSLSIYLCLLLSLCPVARRLVRLIFLVLSTCFLADQRKKKFFPLSFRSLRFACLVLFFFHSICTRGILRCSWRSTPPSCSWCGPSESERCCEPCASAWRIWRGWSALRSFQYLVTALHSSWHSNGSSHHIAVDRRCGAAGGPFFSFLSFFSSSSPSLPSPYPVPLWSSTLLMREESCAPSQLDGSVPVIVHKLGLYVSGTLYYGADCENQSAFFRMSCLTRGLASPLWKRRCCLGSDCVAMNSFS